MSVTRLLCPWCGSPLVYCGCGEKRPLKWGKPRPVTKAERALLDEIRKQLEEEC